MECWINGVIEQRAWSVKRKEYGIKDEELE